MTMKGMITLNKQDCRPHSLLFNVAQTNLLIREIGL